jgi:hypothetical protein
MRVKRAAALAAAAACAQCAAQVVQLPAQVREGLLVGRVRPERRGDPLARLGRAAVDDEECDQRDGARRPHAERTVRGADHLARPAG